MIEYKIFKSKEKMEKYIEKNKNKIQWEKVFINNGYCIEYKKLIIIK